MAKHGLPSTGKTLNWQRTQALRQLVEGPVSPSDMTRLGRRTTSFTGLVADGLARFHYTPLPQWRITEAGRRAAEARKPRAKTKQPIQATTPALPAVPPPVSNANSDQLVDALLLAVDELTKVVDTLKQLSNQK